MDRTPCLGNTSAVRSFGRGLPLPDHHSNISSDRNWQAEARGVGGDRQRVLPAPNPSMTNGGYPEAKKLPIYYAALKESAISKQLFELPLDGTAIF